MKTAIVYTEERLRVNRFFAETLSSYLGADVVDLSVSDDYDLYIFRTEDAALRAELEGKGKRVVNNALTGVIANDKHLSYELAAELGVPFLPYVLQGEGEIGYPCVVKSRFGHGGKQVFWADDKREAERLLKGEGYLLQKPSENRGEDIRMYCLGGEVLAAMRRKNENDFRSNFTLGGSCERIAPPAELVGLCRRFYEALRFDFVGIDFLVEREGYLFNEIEDVVGTRMLYSAGLDAAKRFADYLKSEKCE